MKIFYGTKALWVSFSVITVVMMYYFHVKLPNTNFTETKVDTDRLTNRYIWKATKQRLEDHYSTRPHAQQPRLDWPGEYSPGIQINILLSNILQQYIDIANININIGFSKIAISILKIRLICIPATIISIMNYPLKTYLAGLSK